MRTQLPPHPYPTPPQFTPCCSPPSSPAGTLRKLPTCGMPCCVWLPLAAAECVASLRPPASPLACLPPGAALPSALQPLSHVATAPCRLASSGTATLALNSKTPCAYVLCRSLRHASGRCALPGRRHRQARPRPQSVGLHHGMPGQRRLQVGFAGGANQCPGGGPVLPVLAETCLASTLWPAPNPSPPQPPPHPPPPPTQPLRCAARCPLCKPRPRATCGGSMAGSRRRGRARSR